MRRKAKGSVGKKYDNFSNTKKSKKGRSTIDDFDIIECAQDRIPISKDASPIRILTEAQGHYDIAISQSDIVFGVGPAGTGKSFLAITRAADMLRDGKIQSVIIVRPIVEVGEGMGHLPGTVDEKCDPHFAPIRKMLDRRLGSSFVDYLIKRGQIILTPVNFMRGDTYENCWIIVDEAQNFTKKQIKTILTRIGKNCKVIIDGDDDQIDIKEWDSGLVESMSILKTSGDSDDVIFTSNELTIVRFVEDDIVRSSIARKILKAYSVAKKKVA